MGDAGVCVPGTSSSNLSSETEEWVRQYTIAPMTRDKVETHMSLAGGPFGRLSIPDDMHETWLRVYAAELALDTHSLFFAERRTPIFRMHFDLDFSQPEAVDLLYLASMARDCLQVFQPFYPSLDGVSPMWRCAILTATPKPKKDDDGTVLVKSGCHMVWPWMYVTQTQALVMRATLVDHLTRTWPAREGHSNSYDDVVDRTVLVSNGLRMMGSDKAMRCKTCHNKAARNNCVPCRGRGVLVENRAYTLAMVLGEDGEPDVVRLRAWKADLLTCVRFTSTRSSRLDHSAGFAVPAHAVIDAATKAARKKVKPSAGCGAVETRAEARALTGAVTFESTSRIFSELQKFLNNLASSPHWSGIRITHLYLQHEHGRYTCNVNGPGSSYCNNVGRAHGSSSVYLVIERDGVCQRCFSPKVHEGVTCRAYRSPSVALSTWLQEAMFGAAPVSHSDKTADDIILARSASHTRALKAKVVAKNKKRVDGDKMMEVAGKRRKTSSRGVETPHTVFVGKTCGEVEKMSSAALHAEFALIRKNRIADSAHVHASEVSLGGAVPVTKTKKKGKGGRGTRK